MPAATDRDLAARLLALDAGGPFPAGPSLDALLEEMLATLGSLDPALRDELVYGSLARWCGEGRLGRGQLRRILELCLSDDYLLHRIDEGRLEEVFKRSFSLLGVALVLERDEAEAFLAAEERRAIFARLLEAYRRERVVEGYHPVYGWAHSVAHAADAFALLVGAPGPGPEDIAELLELVAAKFRNADYYFRDGEDERTAKIFARLLARGAEAEKLLHPWIGRLASYEAPKGFPARFTLRGNLRNLLRSLYFAAPEGSETRRLAEAALRPLAFS